MTDQTTKRNPPWNRDELILALDLYVSSEGNPPGKSSPDVVELSALLNRMSSSLSIARNELFRNPSGVYMKLMNFRRFDDRFDGAGLKRGGKLEELIWAEYGNSPSALNSVASQIRDLVEGGSELFPSDPDEAEEYEADESRVVMRVHKSRERDRNLIARKKESVLNTLGKLACEVCNFDFRASYGERGNGFIECHHTKPVSELKPGQKTNLSDLALVCSNCHRMIHRRKPLLTIEQLRHTMRAIL